MTLFENSSLYWKDRSQIYHLKIKKAISFIEGQKEMSYRLTLWKRGDF
jgi:hypothetical protein